MCGCEALPASLLLCPAVGQSILQCIASLEEGNVLKRFLLASTID